MNETLKEQVVEMSEGNPGCLSTRSRPGCQCIVEGCNNRISAWDDQYWCSDHGGETVYDMTDRRGLVAAQKEKGS